MHKIHPGHKFSAKQRTTDVLTEEDVDFESLLLSPLLIKGLADSGFEKPSPIQLKAIPLGRCGLDLIAQAKSGTGKTCVFSVIALENVSTNTAATQALILAPTREIAVQIKDVISAIGCNIKDLKCQVFIGGLPLDEDKKALKGCHIAVGSPGRVKYLIENGFLKTDSVRMFILDEADKLLDGSFQEQINWIYSTLPVNKQMMAFSATYPDYLANHLTRYMREPTFVRLSVTDPSLQGIKQFYCVVPFHHLPHKVFQKKVDQLVNLLSKVNFQQCLLFSNYQIRAQSLSSTLSSKGWPATFIAGSQTQQKRLQAMEKLKEFKCRILISTDLTARGIDAENVNLVVNMDIPRDGETYLHRIGRAGRFGTKGVAVTFVAKGKEEKDLEKLEMSIGISMEALPESIPESLMVSEIPIDSHKDSETTIEVNILRKNPEKTVNPLSAVEKSITQNLQSICEDLKNDSSKDVKSKPDASALQLHLQTAVDQSTLEDDSHSIIQQSDMRNGSGSAENNKSISLDSDCSIINEQIAQEASLVNIFQLELKHKNENSLDKMADKNCTINVTPEMDTPLNSTGLISYDSYDYILTNSEKHAEEKNISKDAAEKSETLDTTYREASFSEERKLALPSVEEFESDFEEYLAMANGFKLPPWDVSNNSTESFNVSQNDEENKYMIIKDCSCLPDEDCLESVKREDGAHKTVNLNTSFKDGFKVNDYSIEDKSCFEDYSNCDDLVGYCIDDAKSSDGDDDRCVKNEERDEYGAHGSEMNECTLNVNDNEEGYGDSELESEDVSDIDDDTSSEDVFDRLKVSDRSSELESDEDVSVSDDDGSSEQHSIKHDDDKNNGAFIDNYYDYKHDHHQACNIGGVQGKRSSCKQSTFQSKIDSRSAYFDPRYFADCNAKPLHNTSDQADIEERKGVMPLIQGSYYSNITNRHKNNPGTTLQRNSLHYHSTGGSTLVDNLRSFQKTNHGDVYMPYPNNRQDDDAIYSSHIHSRHTQDTSFGTSTHPQDLKWRKTWYNAFYTINRTIIQFARKNCNQ